MSSVLRNLKGSVPGAVYSCFAPSLRHHVRLLRSGLHRDTSCVNWKRKCSGSRFNWPPSAEFEARVSGIPTMAKLPYQDSADGLHAAFVGVPIDTGTSNRPGARFGPRQIRVESALLRAYNSGTRAAPYESVMVADIGDVNVNVYDLKDTCRRIRESYRKIVSTGCIPLTMGGDHTIAYPILQAVAEKYGPVGLIHVDAHADVSDVVLGEKIGHGTPFRRCVEEGLLDCPRVVQIGLRGSGYSADSYEWSRSQGFRVVQAEECWHKSLVPLMAEVREQMGDVPVYLSFDIDALDPGFAPGTGTPEIAGLTPIQGVEIIRGCRGLNLVGCDLVEVSPPYNTAGQERFRTITTAYYRGAMGIMLVYDITNEKSFDNIKNWIRNIEEHASSDVERMILGNKCDMNDKRQVSKERGEKLAIDYGIKFLETSAKASINVEEAFLTLARDIMTRLNRRMNDNNPSAAGGPVKITENRPKKSFFRCSLL